MILLETEEKKVIKKVRFGTSVSVFHVITHLSIFSKAQLYQLPRNDVRCLILNFLRL